MFPAALWRYDAPAPAVYRVDTTYTALAREYPEYGYSPWMAGLAGRFQARAGARSALLVTHSDWSRGCLEREHRTPAEKIRVFPNTGALPPEVLPAELGVRELSSPLRLLLVGLDGHRKGLDVAVETLRILNESGIEARLTVCGLPGQDTPLVRFVGPYDKDRGEELALYASLYRETHLLLHPARFDPSPLVVAEAAAFGVPALTHAVGGLGASVEDDRSGVVLAPRSGAEVYARSVAALLADADRYRRLCRGARQRYDRELSWNRFGENLMRVLEEASALGRRAR
jgi:glycosyltransferase involved in cell wall biosynthesis